MKKIMTRIFPVLVGCLLFSAAQAQDMTYQKPPKEILDIVMAPSSPSVSISSDDKWMALLGRTPFVSVEELATAELRLAGSRINPANFGPSRQRYQSGITLMDIATRQEYPVTGIPKGALITFLGWSPNTKNAAFTVTTDDGIYLWMFSVADRAARQVTDRKLNATHGAMLIWLNDEDVVTRLVPAGIGEMPKQPRAPKGPVVQENLGKKTAARTYQDLLKNKYDEDLYDYFFTSQTAIISAGNVKEIGKPGIFTGTSVSPDKSYLLVTEIQKPYSYVVPSYSFPNRTMVWDLQGNTIKTLTENPLVVTAMGYDTSSPYPRGFSWRSDKPSTLYWTEAQDKGNPRENKVEYMDIVYQLEAPFNGQKQELIKTKMRFGGITWGNDDLALYSERSGATRNVKTYRFSPGNLAQPAELLIDRSTDDNYNNPGTPVTVRNEYNRWVLFTDKKNSYLLMRAPGASPEGEMPYISRFDLGTKKTTILWRSEAPYYENIVSVIDPAKEIILTSRQSADEPVNYFIRDLKKKNSVTRLTDFKNPYPFLDGVKKEQIKYKRADGIDLTATVYLPAGYDPEKDGKLPVLMWAYPREYRSAADAAQVRGSQYRFTNISYGSPVYWVTRGYVVMDNVEMPIVGADGVEPNDTFLEQLVMNAEVAIDVIDKMGVGDRNRVAVGGHSYGAFMTANLLTHTNLFKAGIARSGAYNRTLTPFGFQAETRTYWESPEVYNNMSPFMHANKLNGALLLVHGDSDNNSGTFYIQSERFYSALQGHGATVRFVTLPYESHGYAAEENILHLLYETDTWLETYVKNAK